MRIERELMRGAGPVAVLKLLSTAERYGYELVDALDTQTKGVLAMGQSTLYPLLYNLEAKKLIKGVWRTSEAGRDRKYYALTGKGKKKLASDEKQWQTLADAMRALGITDTTAAKARSCKAIFQGALA